MGDYMKYAIQILLGLIFSVLLAACGGGETPAANSKSITTFSLAGAAGAVDETNKTISVTMQSGTNVTALIATFTTTGANVKVGTAIQTSGTTANDFTNPVTYTVIAEDGSTASYTVTVAPPTLGGTVSGLAAGVTLVLQNNGADNLTVSANGKFTFAAPVNAGSAYNVTLLTLPAGQTCTLTYSAGTGTGADIADVTVICGPAFVGAFSATGSMAALRNEHSATLLPNGKVLVAGGWRHDTNNFEIPVASAELYDPFTGIWTDTGSMTTVRSRHTATLLPNGKILVAGGANGAGDLASVELYDPATGAWIATGSMITARSGHTATLLPNGKVLVAGGLKYDLNGTGFLASAELYDPATGAWMATGSMASARDHHTATLLPAGQVLVAGGWNSPGSVTSAELYDSATGIWTTTGNMAGARDHHTATLLPTGKVLVAGGWRADWSDWDLYNVTFLASAELYDPATGTWTTTGSMASSRGQHTATLLPGGKVMVGGGWKCDVSGAGFFASAETYDPATGAWAATGSMANARSRHTATLLSDGRLLMAGGSNATGIPPGAELYW